MTDTHDGSNQMYPDNTQKPQNLGDESAQGAGVFSQQIHHRQLSARVPDAVGRGTFSTGAIVLTGASEFVVDFLVRMARPYQVAARVVLPHASMTQLIRALQDNLSKYENRFGPIAPMPPTDPNAKRPSIQEIYDDLKLPDESLSGVYANACIIGHSPAEFVLDFITNFFPRSAVSSRIYLSSRQAPQLLKSLQHAALQLDQRLRKAQMKNQDDTNTIQNPDLPADTSDHSADTYPRKDDADRGKLEG